MPVNSRAEAELSGRLCRALDTAARVVEFFAAKGYTDAEAPQNSFPPEKVIAETAMLITAAAAVRRLPAVAERTEALIHALLPHARSERVMLKIALQGAATLNLAFPHILLSRLGYGDAAFDGYLRACLAAPGQPGREKPPVGEVERLWTLSLLDLHDEAHWHTVLAASALGHEADLIGGIRDDAYALTHALMYVTSFGATAPDLPRPLAEILAEVEGHLAVRLDGQDFDLAGELLMAWPLTAAPWSATAAFTFRLLATVEDRVGVLPGGTTLSDRLSRLEGLERSRYALATGYHTAFVMGMLCALALHPGREPPARLGRSAVPKEAVDELLSLTDRAGLLGPALEAFPEPNRAAVAPLLLDLALARACRGHDYGAVHRLLDKAPAWGLGSSVLCRQAVTLLDRLAQCTAVMQERRKLMAESVTD